jgi:nicotinamidase-related amidase
MAPSHDGLDEDYRSAGFSARIGIGARPALVVIDVSRAYFETQYPLYAGAEAMLGPLSRILDHCRSTGVPVIHTQVVYSRSKLAETVFRAKIPALACFLEGERSGEFVAEAEPAPGELVIAKEYASAFFGTTLASTLVSHGIDSLLITGVSTSGCVRATAVDAIQHGFRPTVLSDACGDRAAAPHDANLFDLDGKYADVRTVDDVIADLAARG